MNCRQSKTIALRFAESACRGLGLVALCWIFLFRALVRYGDGGYQWLIGGPGILRYFGGLQFQVAWIFVPVLLGIALLIIARGIGVAAESSLGETATPTDGKTDRLAIAYRLTADLLTGTGLACLIASVTIAAWNPTDAATLSWLASGPYPLSALAVARARATTVVVLTAFGITFAVLPNLKKLSDNFKKLYKNTKNSR